MPTRPHYASNATSPTRMGLQTDSGRAMAAAIKHHARLLGRARDLNRSLSNRQKCADSMTSLFSVERFKIRVLSIIFSVTKVREQLALRRLLALPPQSRRETRDKVLYVISVMLSANSVLNPRQLHMFHRSLTPFQADCAALLAPRGRPKATKRE